MRRAGNPSPPMSMATESWNARYRPRAGRTAKTATDHSRMRTVTTHAPVGRRGGAFRGKVVARTARGVASPGMEARSTPVAVRIQRPAATVDAFLRMDRRLFGRKTIALPGAPSKPVGAILRFEIVLADGAPIVRGEGRVISSGPSMVTENRVCYSASRSLIQARKRCLIALRVNALERPARATT